MLKGINMKTIITLMIITASVPGHTQPSSDVISIEQASEIIHRMSVSSYLAGLTDALYDFELYCLPVGITRAEIERVAIRHISMREGYEFHGAPEALEALIEHFPCI